MNIRFWTGDALIFYFGYFGELTRGSFKWSVLNGWRDGLLICRSWRGDETIFYLVNFRHVHRHLLFRRLEGIYKAIFYFWPAPKPANSYTWPGKSIPKPAKSGKTNPGFRGKSGSHYQGDISIHISNVYRYLNTRNTRVPTRTEKRKELMKEMVTELTWLKMYFFGQILWKITITKIF